MKKEKNTKIAFYTLIMVALIFVTNIFMASKRIEKYSVFTPLEDLAFTERIASKLTGSVFKSRDELKKDDLLMSEEYIKKDNENNLRKTDEIKCNYPKSELENMYINPEKYIGQELKFIGIIATDIGMSETEKQYFIDILGKEKVDEMNVDAIVVKINDTDVMVTMMCNKDEIDYDTWKKGTNLKIKGGIAKIEGNSSSININLIDNPDIAIIK